MKLYMRILKIVKSVILIVLMFTILAGCSNVPDGISKEMYKNADEISQIINVNFENKSHLNEDDKNKVESYIEKITSDNFITSSDNENLFIMDIYNLYAYYDFYLLYMSMEDDEKILSIKEKYINIRENLKTTYNISFKNTDN